jgi:hypothetical protein
MAWVTVPALVGPVIGPPVGGFITTYASWHWIFLINIPIGLVGIAFALRFIDPVRAAQLEPFDGRGMLLASLGVAGLAFGLSVAGLDLLPWSIVAALIGGGAVAMTLYVFHARKVKAPPLDFRLTRYPTFHAALIGGFLFRLGIGALPFLLPLMLQIGFRMTPFQSGLVTFATAVGALGMKTLAARIIGTFGFRPVLTVVGVVSAVFLAACGVFTPATPLGLIFLVLLVGGLLPLARIHLDQHHRLCRGECARTLTRDRADGGVAAAVDLGGRGDRRAGRGIDLALERRDGNLGRRFLAGLCRGRADLGVVGAVIRAAAARCRCGNVRPHAGEGSPDRGGRDVGSEARVAIGLILRDAMLCMAPQDEVQE